MIARTLKQLNQSVLLNYRPFYGIRSYNQTIVENQKTFEKGVNTREYYELKNTYGDYELAKRNKELERQKANLDFRISNTSGNDKNPSNFVKVKLNSNVYTNEAQNNNTISQYTYKNPEEYSDPVVLKSLPVEPRITVESYTKKVENSIKRLFYPVRAVRKQHAYDALSILAANNTKAAEQISDAIKKTITKAKLRDMDPNRLFIHGILIGRKSKRMSLRYHARGRFGIKHRQTSTVKVILYEKPVKQLYKEMLAGKTAPVLAYAMRQRFLNENADYEEIRENQWIITAKGRQQRKLMLKRKIQIQYLQFKAKGFTVDKKLIHDRILEQEATMWAKKYEDKQASQTDSSLENRMAIFKKNQELTG